jgi:hypothetical protein
MRICDLSILSGLSRQWLNKLVDRDAVPGCRRKANGRLEILDEEAAANWAAGIAKKPVEKTQQSERSDFRRFGPLLKWIARGQSSGSAKARAAAIGFVAFPGYVEEAGSIADIARQYGITRQALSKALKTAPLPKRTLGARLARPIKS